MWIVRLDKRAGYYRVSVYEKIAKELGLDFSFWVYGS